jgi:hypothetical protein
MLTILDDAASNGMTAAKFEELQSLVSELNVTGGISTSAYVQQIAADVVDGNSANAYWNGGSSSATPLGDLSAASSQTQADELIGKWFLGTDLPSANVSSVGGENIASAYEATTLPLFGANGPSYTDVNQGNVGDCYFLSSLAEVAMQNPSEIKSMIQSNGNGAYSVEFDVAGKADYVTVNNELPVMSGGSQWANGSKLEFANSTTSSWVPLVEKAYAELMEQTDVTPGAALGVNGDSYADIAGGGGQALTELTGQSYNTYGVAAGESSTSLSSMLATLQSRLAAGQEVIMGTSDQSVPGNLVASHMFEVTGVNAAAGAVTLQNPWNEAVAGASSMAMSFTESIAALAADNATFYATTGQPTIA